MASRILAIFCMRCTSHKFREIRAWCTMRNLFCVLSFLATKCTCYNAYRKEQLCERSALRVPSYDARGNECVICPREILDRSFIVMRNIHQLSKHLVILLFIIWVHHCMQFRNCFLQRLINMYNNADQFFLKTIFIVNLMLNSLLKNQVWQSTTRIKYKPVY